MGTLRVGAEESGSMPEQYGEFLGSLGGSADELPEGVLSDDAQEVADAARDMISPARILQMIADAFGRGIGGAIPALVSVLVIVMISAVCYSVSSFCGEGIARALDVCVRLCSFCATGGLAISCANGLKEYFDSLFGAVAAFIPLSATMYAMGGNLTSAASSAATLSVILTVCQFVCGYTVMPVFCICLCGSVTSALDGAAGSLGATVGATVRKWYTAAVAFVMSVLTAALAAQSILSSKADNAAMRGAKIAASSFVPIFGGSISSTLGTLCSSVELMRGSVGIVGIVIIFAMLLPVVTELWLMRAVFSVGAFCAGLVGCPSEQRIMSEAGALYGFLGGAALMCSAVFMIALGIFAASVTPFS
ncbi:MAG: hypothetical protein IJC64_03180 [Clostridia bacterium]|nr:hypothetical protein [Clostridia bacterium]